MRRWGWIIGVLIVVGLALWAWPFIGAAELAAAAERGDTQGVIERVNIPALRRSLARQIAVAYLAATGKADKMGAFGRNMAGAAATTVADPYVGELLTPDNITRILGHGNIGQVSVAGKVMAVNRELPHFTDLLHADIVAIVTGAYLDGIASFVIPVSAGPADSDAYAIHLRLDGLTWKLSGLDLPKAIIDEMAHAVLAAQPEVTQ